MMIPVTRAQVPLRVRRWCRMNDGAKRLMGRVRWRSIRSQAANPVVMVTGAQRQRFVARIRVEPRGHCTRRSRGATGKGDFNELLPRGAVHPRIGWSRST